MIYRWCSVCNRIRTNGKSGICSLCSRYNKNKHVEELPSESMIIKQSGDIE